MVDEVLREIVGPLEKQLEEVVEDVACLCM